MVKVRDVTIRGKKLEVWSDEKGVFHSNIDGGSIDWHATNEGNVISADTMKSLLGKLDNRLKPNSKVKIPFVRWSMPEFDYGYQSGTKERKPYLRQGTITGVHAANGNILVQWADCKGTEQQRSWRDDLYLKMTETQAAAYVKLQQEKIRIEAEIEAQEKKYGIDVKSEISDLKTELD